MNTDSNGADVARGTSRLARELARLRDCIPFAERSAPAVSKWPVGMQIEHSLLVIKGISIALADSTLSSGKRTFSPVRTAILLTGWIPHGRKAPEVTVPMALSSQEQLTALYSDAVRALARAEECASHAWFAHPILGVLTRAQTLCVSVIPTRHHLKIIDRILGAK